MTIHSHKSVGAFPFGAPRAALSTPGIPVRESANRIGEHEVDFGEIIYRFAGDAFVEASFPPPSVLTIDGQQVEGDALIAFLRQHDPRFREVVGFAVAPSLGLAVDLDHDDHWTTAFTAGRWDDLK